jgi:hypothetical protein
VANGELQVRGANTRPAPADAGAGASLSDGFDCSHVVRLSGRQWLAVAVVLLAVVGLGPTLWNQVEVFQPGSDYRLPYELSSDYWLWRRHCSRACDQNRVLVIGDSVIWGHYVPPDETLSHYLNKSAGSPRFANLGLDGTHPAALMGLVQYYGVGLWNRTVVLHFNPLWLSSTKHDLQTDKEFRFNHADLVSQFLVDIPCYKASTAQRLRIAAKRALPFANWVAHLRTVYYGGKDLQTWTLDNPYACPVMPVMRGLPEPGGVPEPSGGTWVEKGGRKQTLSWVTLDSSLQWRFFRRAVELLRRRGNRVFVLVGPFNEHMLTDEDAARYGRIKAEAAAWLQENKVPCFVPEALPAEHYVDASHPIGAGYALLAKELWEQPAFQEVVKGQ